MQKTAIIRSFLLASAVVSSALLTASSQAQVAYDNASLYPNNPDHSWPGNNGGYGYNLCTPLGGISGGGTYMEGVGVNGRQVDGSYSFALYAGGSTGSGSGYAISRPLASSVTSGTFSIITRFDLAGSGPNLVNLRAGNNTSSFGSGELLSFGIVNGSELSYTDSTGLHTISSGEARGGVWDWTVNFDAAAGSYSLSVAQNGGGFSDTVNGSLEASGTSVGSFGVINSSSGNGQNLIFDSPEFQVPEPSIWALLGLGAACVWVLRRKA